MATSYCGQRRSGWEDLSPEILALILVRLPAEERLGCASLVCRNWLACVAGPFCWSEIGIQRWCEKRQRSAEQVDSAACGLMKRSSASFWLLSAPNLGNPGFAFAADCGKNLKVLEIPMSEVTDRTVVKHSESLPNLTTLDISYCMNITSKGIEFFGKSCRSLVQLKRNKPIDFGVDDNEVDDSEAMAVADTMPGLTRLELRYGWFGDSGLQAILANCKALSHLDIDGSWKVLFHDDDVRNACSKLDLFQGPWFEDASGSDFEEDDGYV